MQTPVFGKWQSNVTLTQMCVWELLWGFQNSTAWKDKHKAPCWGNGISCVGRRGSEPMLLWSDLFLVNSLGDYNRYVKCAIHLSPSASRDGEINAVSSWTVGFLAYFSPYKWQGFLLIIFTCTLKKFLGENVAWLADGCVEINCGALHQLQYKEHDQ